jgi:hypothetical protein
MFVKRRLCMKVYGDSSVDSILAVVRPPWGKREIEVAISYASYTENAMFQCWYVMGRYMRTTCMTYNPRPVSFTAHPVEAQVGARQEFIHAGFFHHGTVGVDFLHRLSGVW